MTAGEIEEAKPEEEIKAELITEADAFSLPSDEPVTSTSFETFDAEDFGFIEHYGEEITSPA